MSRRAGTANQHIGDTAQSEPASNPQTLITPGITAAATLPHSYLMTQALPHVSLDSSRLIRFLTDLSVSEAQVSHRQFSDKLGQLINFADAIALSEAHTQAPALEDEGIGEFRVGITTEFLRARSSIVQAAMRSFFPSSGPTRIRWPAIEVESTPDSAATAATLLKFYRAQQVDIYGKVRGLHQRTREAVAQLSPKLSRIAALDAALSDALGSHSQRYFNAVPRLLERRVDHLHSQFLDAKDQPANTAWAETCEQLRREVQGLLLAEVEVRLLPALGLVEALNQDNHDVPDKEIPDED
jgi:hypothetical protein